MLKTDSYGSGDGDAQHVYTVAKDASEENDNDLTGGFSLSDSSSETITTNESGSRSGSPFSVYSTETAGSSTSESGNEVSGAVSSSQTTSDSTSLSDTSSPTGQGFTIFQQDLSSGTTTSTENTLTGVYSQTTYSSDSTSVSQADQSSAGGSGAAQEITYSGGTATETGDSITGVYQSAASESDSSTFIDSGGNSSGAYSVLSVASQTLASSESGNTISGDYTFSENGTQFYSTSETDSYSGSGSGGAESYSLSEIGTKDYSLTQSGSHLTGAYSYAENGGDQYAITESGTSSGGGGGSGGGFGSGGGSGSGGGTGGPSTWNASLEGADTYSVGEDGNELSGAFTRVVTGYGDNTLEEGGSPALSGYNPTPGTNFSVAEGGNYLSGTLSLVESGLDRYGDLPGFNNVSNAVSTPNNGPGDVDFSPIGSPFHIGATPYWGHGPNADLNAAASDAAFNELGLDLLHEYCWRGTTYVFVANDNERPNRAVLKLMREVRPGDKVLCPPENDPHGQPRFMEVEKVFRNQPSALLELRTNRGNLVYPTENHPVYVVERGWTPAAALRAGDRLISRDAKPLRVASVTPTGLVEEVFNLQVARHHTYFISDGDPAFSLLAHNESPGPVDAVFRSGDKVVIEGGAASVGGENLGVEELGARAKGNPPTNAEKAAAGEAEAATGARADKRSHLPSDTRGKWITGRKGNGVFQYHDTPENRAAGVAGKRVRFDKGRIALGGFPADWYYGGNAKKARVNIDNVTGGKADDRAADAAMREKLKDPNWKRPRGYTWNHAGGEGSNAMELVQTGPHKAVHHEGSASGPRANGRVSGAVARGFGALSAYTNVRDALKAAGALEPDYEVAESEYYFVDSDGSVYYIQKRGPIGNLFDSPKKVFVAGPRAGEREAISSAEAQEHQEAGDAQWGKVIPGNLFEGPRFVPGTNRSRIPYTEDGVPKGYLDKDGLHRYEDQGKETPWNGIKAIG